MAAGSIETEGDPTRWGWRRYPRLYRAFAAYCLARELTFRVNFITRCVTGVAWLGILVLFFQLIFLRTGRIGDWDRHEYLFFMGTGFVLNGLVSLLFMENFSNLAELIKSGNLDFALTKPIDEQFLLSCQKMDWSAVPNIGFGVVLLGNACWNTGTAITPTLVFGYVVLLLAGLAVLYSLMLAMASSSVWIVRNTGLYEAWFYVTQFSRYPAEIYRGNALGYFLNFTLSFVLPILLAVNVPARFGMKLVTWPPALYLVAAAIASLVASRWFFRFALRSYRSASS